MCVLSLWLSDSCHACPWSMPQAAGDRQSCEDNFQLDRAVLAVLDSKELQGLVGCSGVHLGQAPSFWLMVLMTLPGFPSGPFSQPSISTL